LLLFYLHFFLFQVFNCPLLILLCTFLSRFQYNEKDVVGICNVGTGTKKEDTKSIGYKGIGFKSVFGKSSFVSIISNGFQFRFDEEKKNGKFPVMPF